MNKESILSVLGISIFGMFILVCTNGMTFSGLTLFDSSLIEEFGWSRGTLKFNGFLNLFCAALIVPFMGVIIDKYGIKPSLIFGLILLSACLFAYSLIQNNMQMYGIHVAFAFGLATAGTLPVVILVTQNISSRRGLALGIALAGTSLGGFILPLIVPTLIENMGWRQTFKFEAIVPLIIAGLVFLFIKNKKGGEDKESKTDDLVEVTFADALKSREFWFLSTIGFFTYYSIMAVYGNLFLYMTELDFTQKEAGYALSIFSIVIVSAKFGSGALTEKLNKYTLFRIQVAIMLLGAIFFAFNTNTSVWIAILLFGIGWGGMYTLINFIIITAFGVNAAGKIGGTISTFESMGAGLGIWLSGLIADKTGNYSLSFWIVAIFLVIALSISFFIRPVERKQNYVS